MIDDTDVTFTQTDERTYMLEIGPHQLHMTDAVAIRLYQVIRDEIGEHVAEMEQAQRDYDRTRRRTYSHTLPQLERDGYEWNDPKHADWHDNIVGLWDNRDKTGGGV